ncbi:hypothetical protein [Niveibacterium sp. SC-1]|uniref:substrate-binding periplasmic protein n=1 Tax=Niveibacterium sp. SC-1 TaxID=3135646 RepID=UPI00311E2EF4
MHRALAGLLAALSLALSPAAAQEKDKVVRLTSYYMPPYAGEELSQQGSTSDVLRRAFAAVGMTLEVEFHTGRHAVALAGAANGSHLGYYPEYFSDELDKRWILSEPVGASPLGFAQRSDNPIFWATPDQLKPYLLGMVQDDVVGGGIGRRIAQGLQRVELAPDETSNLAKLAAGKVDLAIIDSLQFAGLMGNDPRLVSMRGQLVMNPRLIEQRSLHVAFRRSKEGKRVAQLLAEGLRRIGFNAPLGSP